MEPILTSEDQAELGALQSSNLKLLNPWIEGRDAIMGIPNNIGPLTGKYKQKSWHVRQ